MLERNDFLGTDIDKVTGKNHEVGMLLIDDAYHFVDEASVAQKRADVDVAELYDAVAVERLWQQRRRAGSCLHYDVTPAKEKAVGGQHIPDNG